MVSIVGYSRCFQPSTFPPFLLFTHHSLWTKYSKRKASEVFQNHLANLILHSSSLIISFRNHFILNLRGGGMLHSFLTLYFALFSLTSYYWAELSLCSSHDFQSPFNLQKNRDSAFNNLSQMRIWPYKHRSHRSSGRHCPISSLLLCLHRQMEILALMKSVQVLLLPAMGSRFPSNNFCSR